MKKSNVSTVGMDTGTHKMDSDEENYGDRGNDVSHMKITSSYKEALMQSE